MAISRPSECVHFVGSSRRATEPVAWSAAKRSNQPNPLPAHSSAVAQSATAGFVHLPRRSPSSLRKTLERSGKMQYAAIEQSGSALQIGMRQTQQGIIPGNSVIGTFWEVLTIRRGE
jgi:hypothetical protein